MSINNVVLSGRLTRDPELRHVGADNLPVVAFGIAVDEYQKGEKVAHFFDVIAWRKTAELAAKYLTKGREVAISGSLRYRTWEKDGKKNSRVEVVANNIQFFGGSDEPKKQDKPADDDLPF